MEENEKAVRNFQTHGGDFDDCASQSLTALATSGSFRLLQRAVSMVDNQ
jgi:hypothetical protein